MNCESVTRVDTSSLYKNGRLIAQTSVSFMVKRCYEVDLRICSRVFCCCNKRMNQVCFVVTNNGDSVLNNAVLSVNICSQCHCGCGYSNNKIFNINNLNVRCMEKICINLPYPCNMRYKIKALLNVNNVLIKEECINI